MRSQAFDQSMMKRCLQLANAGKGRVEPNPLVGCVIVRNGEIIGEGFHHHFGGTHAEVEAINSVSDKSILCDSTLYVNLEPCNHFGKTPPCTDLIIQHKIQRVVIGCMDSFEKVNGLGIKKLKENGIEVVVGVAEESCKELNSRFFTFHRQKRPYIILKWAQSADGKMDFIRKIPSENRAIISNPLSMQLLHKWRSEESAILVGTNTAILDNPSLTVRHWDGKNPIRIIIDMDLKIPRHYHIFDDSYPTLLFNSIKNKKTKNVEYIQIEKNDFLIEQILKELFLRQIQSLIIEGGRITLDAFISRHLWDEARVFVSEKYIGNGIPAPDFDFYSGKKDKIEDDCLYTVFKK